MGDKLSQLLEHATSQGYRSNIVKPLMGIIIILIVGTIACAYFNKDFVSYVLLSMVGVIFVIFCFSYIYCLVKNPDLLRSEKYNLEKTAIEKVAITGDSIVSPGRVLPPTMEYARIGSIHSDNTTPDDNQA